MSTTSQRRSVIIDTDCGPDDFMAIPFLLSIQQVNVEAITTAYGLANVEKGAKNICKLLELAKRTDIPVYIGEPRPLQGNTKFPALWTQQCEEDVDQFDCFPSTTSKKPESESAHEFLTKRISSGDNVDILAMGALTNIARAIQDVPTSNVKRLVIMGGAIEAAGNVSDFQEFKSPSNLVEWNFFVDPHAAKAVFTSSLPDIHLVPLDATNHVPIDAPFLNTFATKKLTPLGGFVLKVLESVRMYIEKGKYFAWDPLAAMVWLDPNFTKNKETRVEIETDRPHSGQTIVSQTTGKAIQVAVGASKEAFEELYIKVFELPYDN